MRNAVLVSLLLSLLLSIAITAQPITETIEVSVINVDVVVTDGKGNRVTGLTANDFELFEAGKRKAITNFAEYQSSLTAGTAAIEGPRTMAAALPRQPRTLVVFIEHSRLTPFHAKEMYDALRNVVRETISDGDRVMVLSWYGERYKQRLVERSAFTNDVAAVEAVLSQMEREHVHGPFDVSGAGGSIGDEEEAAETEPATGEPSVHTLATASRERSQMKQLTAALETLMHSVSGFEGRKLMLMAVNNYGLYSLGSTFYTETLPVDRRREYSNRTIHDSLVRTANATGVSLYPIYPSGLRWSGPTGGGGLGPTPETDLARGSGDYNTLFNQAMALSDIADRTGGLAAWGAANIAAMLPKMAEDLETYYSLGYRAPGTSQGIARKLEVRTKNRDWTVRARREFVEKSDEEAVKDRVIANLYQASAGSLPFEVEQGTPRSTGRNRWEVPLKLRIPINALTTLPDGSAEAGQFSVYAASGAVAGVMSDVQRRSQPFRIPKEELAKAKESHFTYDFAMQLDEKANRLSIAVVDETGKEIGLRQLAVAGRATQ